MTVKIGPLYEKIKFSKCPRAPPLCTVPQETSLMLGTDLRVSRYPLFIGTRSGTSHRAFSTARKSPRTKKKVKTDPVTSLISRLVAVIFPMGQADPCIKI